MTTLRLLMFLFAFASWPSMHCAACDDVLGVCLETSVNPPGALVKQVRGELARRLRRENDPQQYFLAADLHVITSVNGERVVSRDECVEALKKSDSAISIDVFNVSKGTTRTYTATTSQVQREDEENLHKPGSPHSSLKHVVAGKKPGSWIPEAGYVWVDPKDISAGVRWQHYQRHPQLGGIYSGRKEGTWALQPGFVWASTDPRDLRAHYVGFYESDDGDVFSPGGGYDSGFNGQDAWRIGNQYQHSPWNYRGYTGPSGR